MGGVPVFVRVALALAVMASLTVMALPRAQLAPWGVLNPPEAVIAATVAAAVLLLLGVALSVPAGPHGAATLGLLVAAAVVAGAAVGATALPAVVSTVAWLVSLMLVPAVVQMSLAWPRGWPEHRAEVRLVVATWTLVGVLGVARVVVWDPFADATCVLDCGDNPLALYPDPGLARALLDALLVGTAAACAATAALVLRPSRFWAGGVACVVLAADAIFRLSTDGPLPQDTAVALHQARCVSLALVGGALAMTGWARLRRHGRLLRLAADLDASPAPGTYDASLGHALGDPTLRIAYPVDGQAGVEDRAGQPATPQRTGSGDHGPGARRFRRGRHHPPGRTLRGPCRGLGARGPHGHRQRTAAGPVAGPSRRAACQPGADRRAQRLRTAPTRARSARRGPAAPPHDRLRVASGDAGRPHPGRRPGGTTGTLRPRWTSCATSPTASTRASWSPWGCQRRWMRWPTDPSPSQ